MIIINNGTFSYNIDKYGIGGSSLCREKYYYGSFLLHSRLFELIKQGYCCIVFWPTIEAITYGMDTQDWTAKVTVKQQYKNLQQSFCVHSKA